MNIYKKGDEHELNTSILQYFNTSILQYFNTSILIIAFSLGNVYASEQEKIKINWKLAHAPVEYFLRAANTFKEVVEKETNGEVTVVIDSVAVETREQRHNQSDEVYNLLLKNEVQMTQIYTNEVAKNFSVPAFDMFDLPFLFKDDKHVEKTLEGEIGKNLLAKLDKSPVKGLGYTYSGGFVVHLTKDKKITKVDDYKDLLYRVSMSELIQKGMDTLGVISTIQFQNGKKISGGDAFTRGKVDVDDAIYSDVIQTFQGVRSGNGPNIVNDTRHRVLLTALVMNKEFFNGLSPKHQKAVEKAALIAARKEREHIISDGEKIMNYLQENNIPVVTMSDEERNKMKKKMTSIYNIVYEKAPETKEIIKKITALAN